MTDGAALFKKRKSRSLWAIPLTISAAIPAGFLPPQFDDYGHWISLLIGFSLLYWILAWCHADAAECGFDWPRRMSFWIVGLWIVGVPLYLFRSRGKGAWKSLGWLLVYMFAIFMGFVFVAVALSLAGLEPPPQ